MAWKTTEYNTMKSLFSGGPLVLPSPVSQILALSVQPTSKQHSAPANRRHLVPTARAHATRAPHVTPTRQHRLHCTDRAPTGERRGAIYCGAPARAAAPGRCLKEDAHSMHVCMHYNHERSTYSHCVAITGEVNILSTSHLLLDALTTVPFVIIILPISL